VSRVVNKLEYSNCTNNVLSYVMIDTGSTVNIVSKKFLDELNAVEPVQLMPHNGNVYGIADDACTVIGTAKLTIVLCNQDDNSTRNTFTAKCLVCENIRMECLLGLDALVPKTRPGAKRLSRATVRQLMFACTATATDQNLYRVE
jgi:hypothetical protein